MLRRLFCLLSLLCCLVMTFSAHSQKATELPRQPRILLLLDGSSSMLNSWNGSEIRFKAAARVVEGLMDSIYAVNPDVEFGLRVYGHQSPAQNNDCYDSRMEVMFSKNNATQMGLRLASLRPFGVSPIAYSLRQAAENDLLDDVHNAYSIILITDGGESCGGNICEVVKTLIERKIYFKPYIISLVEYAPLKEQYACLGKYLQVAKPGDLIPAINEIVEAYRPILKAPIIGLRPPVTPPPVQQPEPVKVVPAVTIPAPQPRIAETTAVLRYSGLRALKLVARVAPKPQRIAVPRAPVVAAEPEPRKPETTAVIRPVENPVRGVVAPSPRVTPGTVTIPAAPIAERPRETGDLAALRIRGQRPLRLRMPALVSPALVAVPRAPVVVREPQPTEPPPAVVVRQPVDSPKKPVVVQRPDTPKLPSVTVKNLNPTPVKPASGVKPKVTPPAPVQPPKVNVSAEDAPETRLLVYFTDGRGKFYSSSPQLRLLDAASGKQVKQFYRTVDPNGNPDPQDVAPGTYSLVVASRANIRIPKIVVKENQRTKVIVTVTNGSLRFQYDNNPTRPVTEFNAIVNIRFEDGPVNQKQRCSEEPEYPPGNYHVEIGTLPVMQQNTDIDFGVTTTIMIPEPGFLQFTNTNAVGPVQLFSPLGNRFMRFYALRVLGKAESQRVQLLPGAYEVHWVTNPNTPRAKEAVMKFNIYSNKETAIELN